jgi:hypothetical protein
MTDPNSPWIRFRRWLANKILPTPDPGEAWCIDCDVEGRTVVLPADGTRQHVESHPVGSWVNMSTSWPRSKS